ncbi:MAG: hypothetical protein AAFU73_07235 [Planctomycetota bacterium]
MPGTVAVGDPAARSVFEEAPPRVKLGSIRSVAVSSELVFAGVPDQPHVLDFVCAFPERARLEVEGPSGVQARYRLGAHYWALDRPAAPGGERPRSTELEGETRAAVALDLAARRATFLWPHGGAFEGEGTTRTCPVPGAGVLVATLARGTDELVEMRAFDASGGTVVRLVVDTWAEGEGRRWPARVRLLDGNQTVWTETTTAFETDWFHGDPSFVPPDVLSAATGSQLAALRAVVEPTHYRLETPIRADLTLDDALAAGRAIWGQAGARLGPRLDAHVDLVLGSDETPTHLRLSARPGTAPPPEVAGRGWTLVPEEFTWRHAIPGDGPLPAAALEAVRGRASVGPLVLRSPARRAESSDSTSQESSGRALLTLGRPAESESTREDGPPR